MRNNYLAQQKMLKDNLETELSLIGNNISIESIEIERIIVEYNRVKTKREQLRAEFDNKRYQLNMAETHLLKLEETVRDSLRDTLRK